MCGMYVSLNLYICLLFFFFFSSIFHFIKFLKSEWYNFGKEMFLNDKKLNSVFPYNIKFLSFLILICRKFSTTIKCRAKHFNFNNKNNLPQSAVIFYRYNLPLYFTVTICHNLPLYFTVTICHNLPLYFTVTICRLRI